MPSLASLWNFLAVPTLGISYSLACQKISAISRSNAALLFKLKALFLPLWKKADAYI